MWFYNNHEVYNGAFKISDEEKHHVTIALTPTLVGHFEQSLHSSFMSTQALDVILNHTVKGNSQILDIL